MDASERRVLEEQRAEATRLGLFIGGVSLAFFLLVGAAILWRVVALQRRKQRIEQQQREANEAARKADLEAWKQAQAAEVTSKTETE